MPIACRASLARWHHASLGRASPTRVAHTTRARLGDDDHRRRPRSRWATRGGTHRRSRQSDEIGDTPRWGLAWSRSWGLSVLRHEPAKPVPTRKVSVVAKHVLDGPGLSRASDAFGSPSSTTTRDEPPAQAPFRQARYGDPEGEPTDTKTKSFAQSWQRYALRIPVRSIVTDPVAFTAKLRQCGHSRWLVSFGGGTAVDMAIP